MRSSYRSPPSSPPAAAPASSSCTSTPTRRCRRPRALPPDPSRPPALFDRLRIEVLIDSAAAPGDSLRDFPVDEGQFQAGLVSVGIAPPAGGGNLSARLRLFRADRLLDGQPPPRTTIDLTVQLPPLAGADRVDVSAFLDVETIGRVQPPVDATPGPPASSAVGSWPGAWPQPCARAAGDDEVCVPGGAFFLGDPLLAGTSYHEGGNEQLVVVSPFFLDLHEVTAGQWRTGGGETGLRGPALWNGSTDPLQARSYCTLAAQPGPRDALPLNCVFFGPAREYCKVHGKDLPSEAQLEFVASGRGEEHAYAWGNDEPTCADAVWGRGGIGLLASGDGACRPPLDVGGPLPGGSGARDRVRLDGRELLDLAGSVSELSRDVWSRPGEAYWSRPGILVDPVADLVSAADGPAHSHRGGSWETFPLNLRAGMRQPLFDDAASAAVGFRCARPGR